MARLRRRRADNEKAYPLGKFARVVLRTPNIDYNGRFCMSSAAAAGNRAFGLDRGLPFPLADLGRRGRRAARRQQPRRDHAAGSSQHLSRARERGGLVVVDPRRSATAAFADGRRPACTCSPLPGTDLALLLGLLHVVVAEGWRTTQYVARAHDRRGRGTPRGGRLVAGARRAGHRRAGRAGPARARRGGSRRPPRRAAAPGAYVLTGRGAEQHAKGTDTVTAAIDLALALGLPGRAASGYGCLTGQGNGQGGREHGQKADQLPGYRRIDDPAARAHVAAVWGVDPDDLPGPGRSAVELLDELGGPAVPRALFVHGSNLGGLRAATPRAVRRAPARPGPARRLRRRPERDRDARRRRAAR